jgi:hypothetical protein
LVAFEDMCDLMGQYGRYADRKKLESEQTSKYNKYVILPPMHTPPPMALGFLPGFIIGFSRA